MKTRKQNKYYLSFVIVVLLFGCSTLNRSKTSTPSPVIHQETKTMMPGVASSPLLATSTSAIDTVPICQGKGKHILSSSKSGIPGTIIYQNEDATGLYTIGGTPIIGSQILADETQQNVVFGFSPDDHWLAYSPFDTRNDAKFEHLEVILLSANGKKIKHELSTQEFEDELQVGHQLVGVSGYSYWVNTEMIYVTLYAQSPDTNTSGFISELATVLDPFKGEWVQNFLELPNRLPSGVVGISPDLTRALYDEEGFSLWDYDQKTKIWHNSTLISPFRTMILWSPDSSMAAYASLYDDFSEQSTMIISRDGDVTPIVNKTFPVPGLKILNISWSPDSQYLALASRDGENLSLLIYNVSSGKYVSQCTIAKSNGIWPSLTWSPDSSYIAISDIGSHILIFNTLSGDVLELSQNGIVLGWSDKFPITLP